MNKRREAVKFAQYYFKLIAQKAGVNWDRDNDAEIETLIDFIIEASVKEALNHIPTGVLE